MPNELLIDPGPPTGNDFGPGTPLGTSTPREIRARPLDVDKEIPLLFVDDAPEAASPFAAVAAAVAEGSLHGGTLAASMPVSRQPSATAVGSLVGALTSSPSPHAGVRAVESITIPQCVVTAGWEAPLAARKFRRPT